jgi:hypothetical protein
LFFIGYSRFFSDYLYIYYLKKILPCCNFFSRGTTIGIFSIQFFGSSQIDAHARHKFPPPSPYTQSGVEAKTVVSKAAGAKGVKMLHVTTLQAQFLMRKKKHCQSVWGGYALFGVAKSSLGWP